MIPHGFQLPKIPKHLKLPKRPGANTPRAALEPTGPPPEAAPAQTPSHESPASPRQSRAAEPRQIGLRHRHESRRADPQALSPAVRGTEGSPMGTVGTHPLYDTPSAVPPEPNSPAVPSADPAWKEPVSPRRLAQARLPTRRPDSEHSPQPPDGPEPRRADPDRYTTLAQDVALASRSLRTTKLLRLMQTLRNSGSTLHERDLPELLGLCANAGLSLRDRRSLFQAVVDMLVLPHAGDATHAMCLSWIGALGDEQAQAPWRSIYEQRAQPIELWPAANEHEQNSTLPPDAHGQWTLPPEDWPF